MVIYRLGLPYYKEFDNFQFVGAVMFFLPPHTHLKKMHTTRQYAPCGGQRAGLPTPCPEGNCQLTGRRGRRPLPLHKTKCGRLLTKSSLPHLLV